MKHSYQTINARTIFSKKDEIYFHAILLAIGFSIVDVFGADLGQPTDELVERLAVNHQTTDAFGIVSNYVGRP